MGVEAVSVPGPWAPAFAGATVWGMSWMALMGVGDDGVGVVWEGRCSSISGVEVVSVPGPWAPAFAGATAWRVPVCAEVPDRGRG